MSLSETSALVPLVVRSGFSLMWGTATPAAICRRARALGYRRLALTDTDNLYGLWSFLSACDREGIRPIVGAEVTEPGSRRRSVCLVESPAGYANLCRLLTRRHREPAFQPRGRRGRVRRGAHAPHGHPRPAPVLARCRSFRGRRRAPASRRRRPPPGPRRPGPGRSPRGRAGELFPGSGGRRRPPPAPGDIAQHGPLAACAPGPGPAGRLAGLPRGLRPALPHVPGDDPCRPGPGRAARFHPARFRHGHAPLGGRDGAKRR